MIVRFLKQHLLPFSASLIGLKKLINYTNERMIHVFYHTISDEYLPHISPLYKFQNTKEFERDIDFLLKNFQAVGVGDVLLHAKKEKIITKPSFHLSFDDGLSEIYSVVMPILLRKGVPATVFVNSAFVDNKDLFFRYKAALIIDKLNSLSTAQKRNFPDKSKILGIKYLDRYRLDKTASTLELDFDSFLQQKNPYLTSEEIKTMQQNGFSIGGHSVTHPNYCLLPEEEQIKQTLDSCAYVRETFSEQHQYFAFPFSDEGAGNTFFESIYRRVDLTFGISGIKTSRNGRHIDRIDMENYGKDAKHCIHRAYLTKCLFRASED